MGYKLYGLFENDSLLMLKTLYDFFYNVIVVPYGIVVVCYDLLVIIT